MTTDITQRAEDKQAAIWSLSDLKGLKPDQIIDRIEQIDNQALLYKWRLYWALRQKFPSNIEFGHYLVALRERPHSPFLDSQQVINRYINAGRFAEQHKIGSLEQAGVKPSVIYLLSRPQNSDIADAIFQSIRRKNILHKDVQIMLDQARAVATIEQPWRASNLLEGEVLREEPPKPVELMQPEQAAVVSEPAQAQAAVSRLMQSILEEEPETVKPMTRRRELILELSNMDNGAVSDDEILEDYALLDKSYGRTLLKLAELHNNRKNIIQDAIYKK